MSENKVHDLFPASCRLTIGSTEVKGANTIEWTEGTDAMEGTLGSIDVMEGNVGPLCQNQLRVLCQSYSTNKDRRGICYLSQAISANDNKFAETNPYLHGQVPHEASRRLHDDKTLEDFACLAIHHRNRGLSAFILLTVYTIALIIIVLHLVSKFTSLLYLRSYVLRTTRYNVL